MTDITITSVRSQRTHVELRVVPGFTPSACSTQTAENIIASACTKADTPNLRLLDVTCTGQGVSFALRLEFLEDEKPLDAATVHQAINEALKHYDVIKLPKEPYHSGGPLGYHGIVVDLRSEMPLHYLCEYIHQAVTRYTNTQRLKLCTIDISKEYTGAYTGWKLRTTFDPSNTHLTVEQVKERLAPVLS